MQIRAVFSARFSAALSTSTLAIAFLGLSFNAAAAYVKHSVTEHSITVTGEQQSFVLNAYQGNAIEAVFTSKHHQQLPSYAIAKSAELANAKVIESADTLTFTSGDLSATINKATLAISYVKHGEQHTKALLKQTQFSDSQTGIAFSFAIDDKEKLLGGGQRVLGMDRRGHKLPLYNKAHYGYTTESKQMYYGLPALMSSKKYMLLFDNSATGEMDLDSDGDNTLTLSAVSGRASYIVVAGNSYPNLINHYVDITGKQPMPPRWALGNFASRFGYHNEQEVYDVVERFKQEAMPLDALVLDLYWFGKDIQGHMGNLAWDKNAFPNPEQMIADLNADGVNTVVITEPFILSTSKRWQEAVDANALAVNDKSEPYRFDFYFGNTGLVDVFNDNGKHWFNQAYQRLYEQGVTGWWGDLGEPEVQPDDILHVLPDGSKVRGDAIHNVYGHKWAEMVYEKSLMMAPDKRPMIMMRSGFLGSQRYGLIPWTGDVSRSWGGLKPQVELGLQMGLFGLAYTHSDLGGFAGGQHFDAQMYTRWLQYGAFQPVYRPHAQENIAPEPVFHDELTKYIVRDFINLRYQLLPYNYTLAYQNSTTGMPLMRPLMFENEQDPSLIAEKDTYLWGDAFLVTPVTDVGVKTVNVNFPEGIWFDYFSGNEVIGGKQVDYPVNLTTIPVFVRAGSFIPMTAKLANTKAYNPNEFSLHYYHHDNVKQSAGQLYQDDGISTNSINEKAYQLWKFSADNKLTQLTINFTQSGNGFEGLTDKQAVTLVINNWAHSSNAVQLGDKQLPKVATETGFMLASEGAYFDNKAQTLRIKLTLNNNQQTHHLVIAK